ncbi:MAG: hypothetical protein KAS72_08930 [Phycisphaerales bacterium]|nr:hypothetical protein [Phycisphaerales bacterium]
MAADHSQAERDRDRFYEILRALDERVGRRMLRDCHGRLNWPKRGVYFFFEAGEVRKDGVTPRVVRVGTHAITDKSRTTLWKRLSQHRGTLAGTGYHRGSIFRLHVGRALLNRGDIALNPDTWGRGSSAKGSVTDAERQVEQLVSVYIDDMPFLWVAANDEPSKDCDRAILERNSIGLLSRSCPTGETADVHSGEWLGSHSASDAVRRSHLWNVRDVDVQYDPRFLDLLETCAERTERIA